MSLAIQTCGGLCKGLYRQNRQIYSAVYAVRRESADQAQFCLNALHRQLNFRFGAHAHHGCWCSPESTIHLAGAIIYQPCF